MAGRPTKYRPEYADQAYKLCLLGHTDEELAGFFEVDVATIHRWKAAHEEFRDALKRGKDVADAEVSVSLYKRATGYEQPNTIKVFSYEGEAFFSEPYTEYYPPDPTSMIFWLKNRQKAKWRDKIDHTHAGHDGGPVKHDTTYRYVVVDPKEGA